MKLKSFLLVVTFLVSVLCLNDFSLAQSETPEKTFWGWVKEHQDFLYNLDETNQDQLKQFDEQLNRVNENIAFLIDSKSNNSKRVIILTSFGKTQYFPVINKLYEQKPDLIRLDVVKYIPRGKQIGARRIIGPYIDPDDVCAWIMKNKNGKVSIIFGSSQFDMNYANELMQDLFNFTMEAIGEYDLATEIESVDIAPNNFLSPEVVPLTKLQERLDLLFK